MRRKMSQLDRWEASNPMPRLSGTPTSAPLPASPAYQSSSAGSDSSEEEEEGEHAGYAPQALPHMQSPIHHHAHHDRSAGPAHHRTAGATAASPRVAQSTARAAASTAPPPTLPAATSTGMSERPEVLPKAGLLVKEKPSGLTARTFHFELDTACCLRWRLPTPGKEAPAWVRGGGRKNRTWKGSVQLTAGTRLGRQQNRRASTTAASNCLCVKVDDRQDFIFRAPSQADCVAWMDCLKSAMGMLLRFRDECAHTAASRRMPWMRDDDLVVAPCVGWERNPLSAAIELGSTLVAVDGARVVGADVGQVAEMIAAGAERVRVLALVRPPPWGRLGADDALASAEHVPPMFSPGEYAMVVSDKATSEPAATVAAGAAHATGAAASVAPDGAAAEAAANDGDDARGCGDVLGAIRHYSRAIELCPNKEGMVDLLLDRAEVQLLEDVELQPLKEVQARPREALADCDVALSIAHEIHRECSEAGRGSPPLETRAHIARAKALAMLGRYEEAHDDMSLCVDYIVERDEQESALALLGHIERLMAGNVAATNRGHIQVTIPNKGPLGLLLGNQKAGMPDMGALVEEVSGVAEQSGLIKPGYLLCAINGLDTTRLSFHQTLAALMAAARPVTLDFVTS